MCGLAGFLRRGGLAPGDDALLRGMTDCIAHRGPDDDGRYLDADAGLALGFRRLAILDLTPEGHQPMASRDGRWVMAFNGEVYNFAELKAELESAGDAFRGRSDTEVMLAAIARWGVEPAVRRFAGMFAIALWDTAERALYLVRDRFGEKPLFYGRQGDVFLFGSELKALRRHPSFRASINRDALASFLRFAYVPSPHAIYEGLAKVEPASIVRIAADGGVTSHRYWHLEDVIARGLADPLRADEATVVQALDERLRRTIGEEMVADVPLGAFLSGGIDSSLIVGIMQSLSAAPVRTFTIRFLEPGFNEADHAERVARHLGTDHTELTVTPAEAMAVIPRLPAIYDEPFADPSQIPTFLVAQLARRSVTVALSGDGGDEMFAGYDRYSVTERLWRGAGWAPAWARRGLAQVLQGVSPEGWDSALTPFQAVLPGRLRGVRTGDRAHKLASILASGTPDAMYRQAMSFWDEPLAAVRGAREPATLFDDPSLAAPAGLLERMMHLDARTYLPDGIFTKVDRAGMAVSLESRAPLVDHRVAELAWRIPRSLKYRGGQGKWVLRRVLDRYVPPSLVDRPKMGFGVPVGAWLRGPLKPWAAELLDPARLSREGYFEPGPIQALWSEHQSGRRNWELRLWNVLMFQAWLAARA